MTLTQADSDPSKPKQPLWRSFAAPVMLLSSLALHGLVLFIPTGPAEDVLVPPPDAREEDGISITRVSPATAPTPGPGATPTATPTPLPPATPAPRGVSSVSSGATPGRGGSGSSQRTPVRPTTTPSTSTGAGQGGRPRQPLTPRNDGDGTATDNGRPSNPPPPDVPLATPIPSPPPTNPRASFNEFFRVFNTYRGQVELSPQELAEEAEIWLDGLEDSNPGVRNRVRQIQPLTDFPAIAYGPGLCLPAVPGLAQWLVWVGANGSAVPTSIQQLQGTGYAFFDSAIERALRSHSFPPREAALRVNVAVNYNPTNCRPLANIPGLPREYLAMVESYIGPDRTRFSEGQAAEREWLASLSQGGQVPNAAAQTVPNFAERVPYTARFCLPLAPTTGVWESWWGVVANGRGQGQGEPTLLRSTGYRLMDEAAQRIVSAYRFPVGEGNRAFVVRVPVDYNPLLCEPVGD